MIIFAELGAMINVMQQLYIILPWYDDDMR